MSRVRRGSDGQPIYNPFDATINDYLNQIGDVGKFCVDIAAADGKTASNTYRLFRQGWKGLAVEADVQQFATLAHTYSDFPEVQLYRCYVTPPNVLNLLRTAEAPERFGFLSLDIDGYDHDVLDEILKVYRPALVCVEINEKIPPPILFTVNYSPSYRYSGGACYGQSLSALDRLRASHDYVLLGLEYQNAFLAPAEFGFQSIPVEDAYRMGYAEKADRLRLLPWNVEMEALLTLTPEEGVRFISEKFAQHQGEFICTL